MLPLKNMNLACNCIGHSNSFSQVFIKANRISFWLICWYSQTYKTPPHPHPLFSDHISTNTSVYIFMLLTKDHCFFSVFVLFCFLNHFSLGGLLSGAPPYTHIYKKKIKKKWKVGRCEGEGGVRVSSHPLSTKSHPQIVLQTNTCQLHKCSFFFYYALLKQTKKNSAKQQ